MRIAVREGERRGIAAGPVGRALTAVPRALLVVLSVLGFFAVGVPLQLGLQRLGPTRRPFAADAPLRLLCRLLLRLVGVGVEVGGAPVGEGAVLLAANHVSWIDIPALMGAMPFCFLAKADIRSWPLVSTIVAAQGTVFVDRRRRRSIIPANLTMAMRLREGRRMLFFPEGTTLAGPLPGPFLSSHFAAATQLAAAGGDCRVQPVAILYSSPDAAWVGDDSLVAHVWRMLLGPRLRCRIEFGAPIPLHRGDNRKRVAALARDAVSAALAGMMATTDGAGIEHDPPNDPLARPSAPHYENKP